MIIGLDYDETYTLDPSFWDQFIAKAKESGHKVYIVTARRSTPENVEQVQVPGCLVVFTGLASKIWWMEHYYEKVDVWIDDDPLTCAQGH